ncbi:MAG: hypothetical protein ACJ770_00855, partial [Gemmatimonadaceae bacterium]
MCSILGGCEYVIQPHVRIPDRKCVTGIGSMIRVKRTPRVDITIGPHHLDCAARYITPAEPDHSAYPHWHRRRVERFPGRQRVEISSENMEREGVFLPNQLLLYPVEQTSQLLSTASLGPLGETRSKMEYEHRRNTIGKRFLEQCVARP